ncbi:MAG: nucleotidyltransferase domain-containing protein [Ignavibacteria bacterium]|nr:nucleotidyltransferase domain-containing protein [Ignavibacteria bacterium]
MLHQNKLTQLSQKIVETIHPEKIILFGSYAYGVPKETSDVDILVVVKNSNQPRYKRAREIRKKLWGLTSIPKDILVYTESEIEEWKNVKEAFITTAFEQGKILYENKTRIS